MPPHSILVKAALLIPKHDRYFPTLTCTRQIFNCLTPWMAGPADSDLHLDFDPGCQQFAVFRRADTFRFATRLVLDGQGSDGSVQFSEDDVKEIINSVDYLRSIEFRWRIDAFDTLGEFLAQLPHLECLRLFECDVPLDFFRPLLKARSLSLRCDAAQALLDCHRGDVLDRTDFLSDIFIPAIDAAQTNGELVEMLQLVQCLSEWPDEDIGIEVFEQALQRIENCAAQADYYPPLRATALAAFACLGCVGFTMRRQPELHDVTFKHPLWSDCAGFLNEFEQRHRGTELRHYANLLDEREFHCVPDDFLRHLTAATQIMSTFASVLISAAQVVVPVTCIRMIATPFMRLKHSNDFDDLCCAVVRLDDDSLDRKLLNRILPALSGHARNPGWNGDVSPRFARPVVEALLENRYIKELCLELHRSSGQLAAMQLRLKHSLDDDDDVTATDSSVVEALQHKVDSHVKTLRSALCLRRLRILDSVDDKAWFREVLLPTLFAPSVADTNNSVSESYDLGPILDQVARFGTHKELTLNSDVIRLERMVMGDLHYQTTSNTKGFKRRRQREEDGAATEEATTKKKETRQMNGRRRFVEEAFAFL